MDRKLIISTAAVLFAAATVATAAHGQATNRCYGINSCKGQGFLFEKSKHACLKLGGHLS